MIDNIVDSIVSSKKYKGIYPKTVERIVRETSRRYVPKDVEKNSKNLLHQIWGSYYTHYPDFEKLTDNFKKNLQDCNDIKETIIPILKIHSSTAERIPISIDFYKKIFEITGSPSSIVDIACGLNPLMFPWMSLASDCKYLSYDIDIFEVEFLNNVFSILGQNNRFKSFAGDIFIDSFPSCDIVFMLKLLPLLYLQDKGEVINILSNLECNFIIISFPTRSLSGKNVGMESNYSHMIESIINTQKWKISRLVFRSELVYVIKK